MPKESVASLRKDVQAHLAALAVLQDRERVWKGELEREIAKREAAERENEELRNGQRVLARFRKNAEAEVTRLREVLDDAPNITDRFVADYEAWMNQRRAALSRRDTV